MIFNSKPVQTNLNNSKISKIQEIRQIKFPEEQWLALAACSGLCKADVEERRMELV